MVIEMQETDGKNIIVALDFPDERGTRTMLDKLDPALCRVKVGKELFTRCGPALVGRMVADGFEVFLDLKYHDIPNTVAAAVSAAADLGVWMLNVHASGGRRMMAAAREALDKCDNRPLLIGVTVLTSMSAEDLREVGVQLEPQAQVQKLALLTRDCGLDGVVCSAMECAGLRQLLGTSFTLVTPGIRPAGDQAGDQRRVQTPASALASGSDYLVIGRPITQAADPGQKLRAILEEISGKK